MSLPMSDRFLRSSEKAEPSAARSGPHVFVGSVTRGVAGAGIKVAARLSRCRGRAPGLRLRLHSCRAMTLLASALALVLVGGIRSWPLLQ